MSIRIDNELVNDNIYSNGDQFDALFKINKKLAIGRFMSKNICIMIIYRILR